MPKRVRHPWWSEAALRLRGQAHPSRSVAAAAALACIAIVVAGLAARLDPHGSVARTMTDALSRLAAHAGLLGLITGLVAYIASHRVAQARADQLQAGWWRAAPVDRGSIDRTVMTVSILGGGVAIVVLLVVLIALAALTARPVPHAALQAVAFAIATGCVVGAAHVVWRRRHPPRRYRAGVRVPLLRLRAPSSAAPHLFDWQRREAVLRWRRGGNIKLIGVVLALTPGATHPAQMAGVLLLAAAAAWLGTVIEASGDVATRARDTMRATPIDPALLRRAGWHYPLRALAAGVLLFACGTGLLGGAGLLGGLWAVVALMLSLRGLVRLARTPVAGSMR